MSLSALCLVHLQPCGWAVTRQSRSRKSATAFLINPLDKYLLGERPHALHIPQDNLRSTSGSAGCHRHEMSAHIADDTAMHEVGKQVESSIILLRKLTGLEKSHDVGKSQKMPIQEIQQAAGLAFFEASKVGLVITGITGKGFVIQRLKGQPGAWSAPVFFTIKSLGIGASAGFSSSHTVLVLDNEKSVNDFLHTQVSLDSEMTLAAGRAARHMHDSELNVTHPSDSFQGAMYSVAHGAMVDVSFQGVKVSVNEKEMKKLYGSGIDDKQILSGQHPQLPILDPLIQEIELLQQGGTRSGTTVRDFTSGKGEVHPQSGNLGQQVKDAFHKH